MSKKDIEKFPDITGKHTDSFAHFTIHQRLPIILDQIIEQNDFNPQINLKLNNLKFEVEHDVIKLFDTTFPDHDLWSGFFELNTGKHWEEVQFYGIEAYFYRRIVEITGFFRENDRDPFQVTKSSDIADNNEFFKKALNDQQSMLHNPNGEKDLKDLLLLNLWGNKSDLSQIQNTRSSTLSSLNQFSTDHLLIDHCDELVADLIQSVDRVDVILDNAGVELFTDLLLADYLLANSLVRQIHFHAKFHPTFVSDATTNDIRILLDFLSKSGQTIVLEFIRRIEDAQKDGKLFFHQYLFWNSPRHFYDMPAGIKHELQRSDLIVFKGDANYRRLLGDRDLPVDQSIRKLIDYLPAPGLTIRTLKSELIIGLEKEQVRILDQADKDWRISGEYGMIQII